LVKDWVSYLADRKKGFISDNTIKLGLPVFMALLGASIPSWSFSTFAIEILVMAIAGMVLYYWYKHVSNETKYQTLTGFMMLFLIGVFLAIPLLRLTADTLTFWAFLLALLLIMAESVLNNRAISRTLNMSGKLKLPSGLVLISVLLLVFFAFLLRDGDQSVMSRLFALNEAQVIFSTLFYAGSLLLTWLAFVNLKGLKEV